MKGLLLPLSRVATPQPPLRTSRRAFGAAFCFHAYQQVSYLILQRVSPVTHSIGNCVKRVVVILASILVFQNPVTRQGAIGTAIALAGVFAYSQAKVSALRTRSGREEHG